MIQFDLYFSGNHQPVVVYFNEKKQIFQVGFKLNRTTTSLQLVLEDVSKEMCKGLELSIHHPQSHRSSRPFFLACNKKLVQPCGYCGSGKLAMGSVCCVFFNLRG